MPAGANQIHRGPSALIQRCKGVSFLWAQSKRWARLQPKACIVIVFDDEVPSSAKRFKQRLVSAASCS